MSSEEKTNQTETSTIDNLKKLSQLLSSEKVPHLLKEIQSAKKNLESLYKNVSEKHNQMLEKEEKVSAKIETTENVSAISAPILDAKQEAPKSFSTDKEISTPQNYVKKPYVQTNTDYKNSSVPNTNYNRPIGQGTYNRPQTTTGGYNRPQTNQTGGTYNRPQTSGTYNRPQGQSTYNRPQGTTTGTYNRPYNAGFNNGGQRPPYTPYNKDGQSRPPYNSPYNKDAVNTTRPFNKPRPFGKDLSTPAGDEIIELEVKNKFANNNIKPKTNEYDKKKPTLTKKQLIKRNFIEGESEEERLLTRRPKKKVKEQVIVAPKVLNHAVITTENLTVKVLAESIGKPVNEIVKKLVLLGIMATINSVIDYDTAELVASELGITLEKNVEKTYEEKLVDIMIESKEEDDKNLKPRAPIVTVMGHVDHGKTSLLDAIRKTNVTTGEAGGITQHIGAYMVKTDKGKITFIDTPGHAAFTEMRARGAKVTDIAVLVVAADDGIMPQTMEAIRHIKAAEVPMVVAINKIDKPDADIERVKKQLADNGVLCEDWGGDTIMVPVSARTKEGIDKLLDMILLVAEVKELKANPNKSGIGTIIEAKLDKGLGPIATIIVENGTLKVGDQIIAGVASGRIRTMIDDQGKEIKKAQPSTPVAVVGFDIVPEAGSIANVVTEKMMKELVFERQDKLKEERQLSVKAINVEDLFSKTNSQIKTLNIIIKAGVKGIVEALQQSLEKLQNEEAKVHCIHCAAGAINENDVLLAQTTNSIIIGFNVKPDVNAKKVADKLNVDMRFYNVIYNVIDDISLIIKGMVTPKFKEVIIGHAEVRVLYKISKVGTIAGCMVKDGRITKNSKVRVLRNNAVIADEAVDTLKIMKDDVKEVKTGFEFGMKLTNFNDYKEGDTIEAYINEQIKN